jgi:hypothetical protein
MIKFISLILFVLIIFSPIIICSTPCLSAQECKTSIENFKVKCSSSGKCFYDALGYFLTNKTSLFQTCVCDEGYTTLPADDVYCCYKKKSQFLAFMLEFVFGFGLGHFYIGNDTIGIIKLISAGLLCCSCCTISYCFCNREDKISDSMENSEHPLSYQIFNFILIFSVCVYIIWQCTDAVLFGLNLLQDSNGIELNPW